MHIWLPVAIEWFIGITTPALIVIGLFVVRTKPQECLLMPVAEPVEYVSISEIETKRMKSVK
jgi:hypothetical protein